MQIWKRNSRRRTKRIVMKKRKKNSRRRRAMAITEVSILIMIIMKNRALKSWTTSRMIWSRMTQTSRTRAMTKRWMCLGLMTTWGHLWMTGWSFRIQLKMQSIIWWKGRSTCSNLKIRTLRWNSYSAYRSKKPKSLQFWLCSCCSWTKWLSWETY